VRTLASLDVGCGGGFFTVKVAKNYPTAKVTGIDTNPEAVAFAQNLLKKLPHPPTNVFFEKREQPQLQEPEGLYDIISATLVCHHMKDEELVAFLKQAFSLANQGIIINDLHRHPVAYYAFKGLAPVFFRNRIVQHDGPLSIRRAFTRSEWESYLGVLTQFRNVLFQAI